MTSRELDDPAEPEPEFRHASSAGELRKILHEILTAQQHHSAAQRQTNIHLKHLETAMADLNTALTDLQTSVDAAVTVLTTQVQPLKDALAKAQADLADLQVQDDADKAALQASLDGAQAAADSIETEVSKLNAADSTTP